MKEDTRKDEEKRLINVGVKLTYSFSPKICIEYYVLRSTIVKGYASLLYV